MATGNQHSWYRRHPFSILALVVAILAAGLLGTGASLALAQPAPLSTVPVPTRSGGDIVDQAAAIRLGKALYWDTQVGGDGQIACATCHFNAGTDNRTFNSLHPGPGGAFATDGVNGPGQTLTLTNILNDDRVGSQGIVGSLFVGIDPDPANAADVCNPDTAPTPFLTALASHRRVTGRQAPPTIGAVFNRQNFWDGRANDNFNGLNPFGLTGNAGGALGTTVTNSSLASQAVGPPNNETEMSCKGRTFNGPQSLAAKLLARPALQHQVVHPADGVLGRLSASPANGLNCGGHACSYTELIAAAFGPTAAADAVNRFSRIWGQAIQAYVSTLIPDRTPMDLFLAGNAAALTAQQQKGLSAFTGKAGCTRCHVGAELTDASVSNAARRGLINEDGGDQGFHNIGVRPTDEDLGRAALGPNGVSFSQSGATADRGAFKTAALRNVKLTAPYFHNGGKATLADVVDFYIRGGDFNSTEKARRIKPLGLSSLERTQLIDFLTNGLTDCRVERDEPPFDHPSLTVPNGRVVAGVAVDLELPAAGGGNTCP